MNGNDGEHFDVIRKAAGRILAELPSHVLLVAAAKTRTASEVAAVMEAGITHIGHNYVQETEAMIPEVGEKAIWHFIGHLQKNKVKKAARLFDMIETVDSLDLARRLNNECGQLGKIMPILIEVNSGREEAKAGVMPEEAESLVVSFKDMENIRVEGLMTMGPFTGDPEEARPYFVETRKIFDSLKEREIPHIQMRYLSMGMSNSYKVAIEEGANIVRLGTLLFGPR
jgi:pyridoxal phosphate enzyme (YggS family)